MGIEDVLPESASSAWWVSWWASQEDGHAQ